MEGKWLWLVNTIVLDLHSDDISFVVLGLCGFFGVVLRDLMKKFVQINKMHSFLPRVDFLLKIVQNIIYFSVYSVRSHFDHN